MGFGGAAVRAQFVGWLLMTQGGRCRKTVFMSRPGGKRKSVRRSSNGGFAPIPVIHRDYSIFYNQTFAQIG